MLILASTFSFVGHSTELGVEGSIAVTMHVAVALWWAGSLYPLWRATQSLQPESLQMALYRFGHIASGLLVGMILGGAVLLYLLVIAPDGEVSTVYATAVFVKLTIVTILFGIAAMHKWRSVPHLLQQGRIAAFQRSLGLEITLMLLVLALTSVLSSAIGPSSY
jgi:putative copper resistance protein D